jgi:hypothetical protein
MKIPTAPSVRRADASLDMKLNPVELSSKEIVSWGVAFPRRAAGTPSPVAETATSPDPKVWRMDATIGSVLGTVAGKPALPSSD